MNADDSQQAAVLWAIIMPGSGNIIQTATGVQNPKLNSVQQSCDQWKRSQS
jgi:hypothetical protein